MAGDRDSTLPRRAALTGAAAFAVLPVAAAAPAAGAPGAGSVVAIGQQLRRLYAEHHRLDLAALAADASTYEARSAAADAAFTRIDDLGTMALRTRAGTLADAALQAGLCLEEVAGFIGHVGPPGSHADTSLRSMRAALAGITELLARTAGIGVDQLGLPDLAAAVERWRV